MTFILPTRKDGTPIKPLKNSLQGPLRRLQQLDSEPVSSSATSDWEIEVSSNDRSPASHTALEPEPAEEKDSLRSAPVSGFVLADLVVEEDDGIRSHSCAHCGEVISPGTCIISWQQEEDALIYDLHFNCCAPWSVSNDIAFDMMNALVDHQPYAPAKVQGVVNMVLNDLLEMTKGSGMQPPPVPPRPRPIQLRNTLPGRCPEVPDGDNETCLPDSQETLVLGATGQED